MQTRNSNGDATPTVPVGAIAAVVARKLEGAANGRETSEKREMSVIGADIVITGNIEASVDLHIEGKVIGDVRCATLILGENSSVNGRIYAARVKVAGTVEGAVETKDLAIEASARVIGDISYERLRVANGATVEGNVMRRIPADGDDAARLKLVAETTAAADPADMLDD